MLQQISAAQNSLFSLSRCYQCDCIILASFTFLYHGFPFLKSLIFFLTVPYLIMYLGQTVLQIHCQILFWSGFHVLNFNKGMWADVLDVTTWWYDYPAENSF